MLKSLANLMTAFGTRPTYRLGLVVAAACLLVVVTTERTEASCGDYLVIGGMNHTMDQSYADEDPSSDESQVPLGAPCHGPQCRQSPAMPVPPLPVQSGPSQQDQAHLQQLSDSKLPSPFSHRVVETSARPVPGFPFRLERPPHA